MVIGLWLYFENTKFKMIAELLVSGMAKSLNLLVNLAFSEGLNGTFKANGWKEKPINFWIWFDFGLKQEEHTN